MERKKNSTVQFTVVPEEDSEQLPLPTKVANVQKSTPINSQQIGQKNRLPKMADTQSFLLVLIGVECGLLFALLVALKKSEKERKNEHRYEK